MGSGNRARNARRGDVSGKMVKKSAGGKRVAFSNPFETRKNKKQKFTVLNRKTKGAERNVALARSKSHEKRANTLLADYIKSTKSNSIEDKRFGEGKEGMSKEDKAFMRFQQSRKKKNRYNLQDDDGEENLGVFGQSMGEDASRTIGPDDVFEDDEDDGYHEKMDANELMRRMQEQGISHLKRKFGEHLTDEELQQKKTKKEIMEEVMKKSKLFKMERQRQHEEDEDEREQLDEKIDEMLSQGILAARPTKKQVQEAEKQAILDRLMARQSGKKVEEKSVKAAGDKEEEVVETEIDVDYERAVRELQFERRLAASNRTKTAEEIAREEREELEEQQKALLRRMKGDFSDSEDEADGSRKPKRRAAGGDDLGDEWGIVGGGEEESESDDSEEESSSDEEAKTISQPKPKRRKDPHIAMMEAQKSLPFLLDVTGTHIELMELLKRYPEADLKTVVFRIAKTNSVHLAAENRQQMILFVGVLLEHLAFQVDRSVYLGASGDAQSARLAQQDGDVIVEALYNISKEAPMEVSRAFMKRLDAIQRTLGINLSNAATQGRLAGGDYGALEASAGLPSKVLKKRKSGGHKGAKGRKKLAEEAEQEDHEEHVYAEDLELMLSSDCRCWPSPGELATFRAIAKLFPVTDYRHPVVTPAQLLLGQILSQCPLRGARDAVACLAVCDLALAFTKDAGRVMPEVLVALEALVGQMVAPLPEAAVGAAQERVLSSAVTTSAIAARGLDALDQFDWLRRGLVGGFRAKGKAKKAEASALDISFLRFGDDGVGQPTVALCHSILSAASQMLLTCVRCMGKNEGCDLLFGGLLEKLPADRLKKLGKETTCFWELVAAREEVVAQCNSVIEARKPLQLQSFKAEAIKAMTPRFNENYQWSKLNDDPDKERAEMKKMKKKVQRERKGVARELRRDGQFLAEIRTREKLERANELRDERRKNMSFLQTQAADFTMAVKHAGHHVRGGGTGGVDLKGRRKK